MIRSVYSVAAVIIFFLTSCPRTDAFTTPASLSCRSGTIAVASLNVPRRSPPSDLRMIFGPPKDDGKPGDYLCKDCGYVFTKGPEAWAKLPDNYSIIIYIGSRTVARLLLQNIASPLTEDRECDQPFGPSSTVLVWLQRLNWSDWVASME